MKPFRLTSFYQPQGDQPQAIQTLLHSIQQGNDYATLLGVTGSGKTFTMANLIQALQWPSLVIAPNKTLAAQLYSEFKDFFPENQVEYFVSYYDYYQPEAYVPSKDLYIEKDADINEEIERLRQSTVRSLIERRDTIVVASVSCIYGWQEPSDYLDNLLKIQQGMILNRNEFIKMLLKLQYERNDIQFTRGAFRVRGSLVDVFPAEVEDQAIRIEFGDDIIESISIIKPLLGKKIEEIDSFVFFQAKQFVTSRERLKVALPRIREEIVERIQYFNHLGRPLEAERIQQRAYQDLEYLEQTGGCPGVENYSRHLALRDAGSTPSTIIDYFEPPFLTFIDESHITVPQIKGMYRGDQSRKQNLVEYGFRLPSALDNRPLRWEEFIQKKDKIIFVSATPGDLELSMSATCAEQIIRPTGLVDPRIEIQPTQNQIDTLEKEIQATIHQGYRILVTTLTKRMAEDLSICFLEKGIKSKYLHSDIDTIERVEIIKQLREGSFDCLVGINLLREGLDLPEVALIAILDADKEGFLRSRTSLIQTIGRAARNVHGKVILFADSITDSMKKAIEETNRRRELQIQYNQTNHIHPETIQKVVKEMISLDHAQPEKVPGWDKGKKGLNEDTIKRMIWELESEMHERAKWLEFEEAVKLRDKIKQWKKILAERFLHQQEDDNAGQKMDQRKSKTVNRSSR